MPQLLTFVAAIGTGLEGQFVLDAPTMKGSVNDEVLTINQPSEMHLELGVSPTKSLSNLPTVEPDVLLLDNITGSNSCNHGIKKAKKLSGLGRKIVQARAGYLCHEPRSQLHVGLGGLDVLNHMTLVFHGTDWSLMLVEESQGLDQPEELPVVTACSNPVITIDHPQGVRVDHPQRPKEPLGILVELDHLALAFGSKDPLKRLGLPLTLMDLPGLLRTFVN